MYLFHQLILQAVLFVNKNSAWTTVKCKNFAFNERKQNTLKSLRQAKMQKFCI